MSILEMIKIPTERNYSRQQQNGSIQNNLTVLELKSRSISGWLSGVLANTSRSFLRGTRSLFTGEDRLQAKGNLLRWTDNNFFRPHLRHQPQTIGHLNGESCHPCFIAKSQKRRKRTKQTWLDCLRERKAAMRKIPALLGLQRKRSVHARHCGGNTVDLSLQDDVKIS